MAVAWGSATSSTGSQDLGLTAARNGRHRTFSFYFFGEPAILFVDEAIISVGKKRGAQFIACARLVPRLKAAESE
jgi:hypothetical protein